MKKALITLALCSLALASPASANHFLNLEVPFPTRGACEAEVAELANGDRDPLLARFPNLFSSRGEVTSFLTRAFPCERNPADGQWYIQDDRVEVLESDWFLRR